MHEWVAWLWLVTLGAFHGVNPAMGWLFAVARGRQTGSRTTVIESLGPIAIGHAASIAVVAMLLGVAQLAVTPEQMRVTAALALIAFGIFKLIADGAHPRWVGMRVNGRDLVGWSFLMTSAHGAGLMLAPVLVGSGPQGATATAYAGLAEHMDAAAPHAGHLGVMAAGPLAGVLAVTLHSAVTLLVTWGTPSHARSR